MLTTMASEAQNSQWTRPQDSSTPAQRKVEKTTVDADADSKYLAGAVPEVDGKIVFSRQIAAKGRDAGQVYKLLLDKLQRMVKEENQIKSQVAIVSESTHEIGATFEEWLEFKKTALVLDRARFYYTLHAECKDGCAQVTVSRLHYLYEEEREPQKLTAEEWISDAEALNKKKTKLVRMSAKFRRKTVDRMEQLFDELTQALL